MDNTYFPLITGFGGVLIGSLSTIATVFLQLRSQDRRERIELLPVWLRKNGRCCSILRTRKTEDLLFLRCRFL
jgi:hypothetical protein